MSENQKEEFIYHNGIAYASDQDEKKAEQAKRKKDKGEYYWFTGIQAIVCIAFLLAVLILKGINSDWFWKVKAWYEENINQSVLIDYDPGEVKREILDLFGKKEQENDQI